MRLLYDIESYLGKQTRPVLILFSISMMLALEAVNYFLGHEFRLIVFYFIPLFIMVWFVDIKWAFLWSVLIALSWFIVGRFVLNISLAGHAWNSATRLAILVVFIIMVNAYKRERVFAREDFLTKIANNQHFAEFATMEIERCRRYSRSFSVVYIDVDNFKAVNDSFGHTTGNTLLYEVAQGIQRNIRASDMVARLGGDEFAILLPETGYEQVGAIIPKLRETLIAIMRQNQWPVTFSFGVVTFLKAPQDFDEMVRQADILMYRAKNEGKDAIRSGIYR